jgi:pyruvate dehydrogenase E1 component
MRAIRDRDGHDLGDLLDAFAHADAVSDRPSVIFAYTIKAWRLATQRHPANHSALLSVAQMEELAGATGGEPSDPWARLPERLRRGRALCRGLAASRAPRDRADCRADAPGDLGRVHAGPASTQQAFGRFVADLSHKAPELRGEDRDRKPGRASSTNLDDWINDVGIWHLGERIAWFADDTDTLVRWRESEHSQHIELRIAERNPVGLLGDLGVTWSPGGQALLPIGTLCDPFVGRAFLVIWPVHGRPRGHPVRSHACAAKVSEHLRDGARS